jgi:hypothetical protein
MSTTGEPYAMADTLTDIKTGMASMGTKLDLLIQRIDPVITDHESRLRKLEQKVWLASGVALAGGGALGATLSAVLGN